MSLLKKLRISSQILFLSLFFFLLVRTEYHGRDVIAYPVRIFLEIDPLILLGTFLSSHSIVKGLLWSLIVLVITVVLGRAFCGWVCPLGTLNDAVGFFNRRNANKQWNPRIEAAGLKVKYYILFFLLFCAIFQIHFVGIMDPVSLSIRSLSLSALPLVNYLSHGFFDLLYRVDLAPIRAVSEPVYGFLKLHVLSFNPPRFEQASLIGFLFLFILVLNLIRKRFWCRFLCPLGALLALLSRFSLLNYTLEEESCDDCRRCLTSCSGGADPYPAGAWRGAECVLCFNCENTCSLHAVSFGFGRPQPEKRRTDLKRRYLVGAGISALGSLALFRLNPVRAIGSDILVRPPGAISEEDFLKRCVKCGECMKVCITNGLHPTFLQAGFEGIWSPVLIPRIGYCEFSCTLCGQVCPTGAIEKLDVETKRKRKIGLAFIDKNRCLPYAFNTNCIVCEEHCPTSPKAVVFEEKIVQDENGRPKTLKQPIVDPEVCTGCGICEYKCPVGEEAAIRVSSVGEDRSERHKLFL